MLSVDKMKCLNDKGLDALHEVSFEVCAGEILGIAGVSGNGQTELAEVITGMRRAKSGSVTILEKKRY